MTDLNIFFATYGGFVLLTKACKMYGALSYMVVNILIEVASNSARYTGGKLAIGRHLDTCMPDIRIRHVATDLTRQPGQLSCYFLLHAISSVYYLQLL